MRVKSVQKSATSNSIKSHPAVIVASPVPALSTDLWEPCPGPSRVTTHTSSRNTPSEPQHGTAGALGYFSTLVRARGIPDARSKLTGCSEDMEFVEVFDSPGKGRGLRATKELWAGDVLFAEAPLASVVLDR